MRLRLSTAWIATLIACLAAPAMATGVAVGELDTFSAGLESWRQGAPPFGGLGAFRELTGGPTGLDDAYLRVASGGGEANLGKLIVINDDQWSGDFATAGVTSISMDVKNFGATDLSLRISLGESSAPRFGGVWVHSAVPVSVPAMSGWTSISFPLGAANFTGGDYSAVIDRVLSMRIGHVTMADPGYGDPVVGNLGIDNILAVGGSTPIPGDFNGVDGVTGADLAQWTGDYGLNGDSDADGDDDSDGHDFLIWQQNLGQGTSVAAISAIPEPTTLTLAIALLLVGARRLRSRGRL